MILMAPGIGSGAIIRWLVNARVLNIIFYKLNFASEQRSKFSMAYDE